MASETVALPCDHLADGDSSAALIQSVIAISFRVIIIFTSLRERDKREKSEEKIDCHHQDSNQGPSLVASDALTTELWCSRHPSRDCSTFSSDFVTFPLLLLLL